MSLANDIKKREIDQKAETIKELSAATGYNRSWMDNYAAEQVRIGKWEKVLKRASGRTVPAYRRKAK